MKIKGICLVFNEMMQLRCKLEIKACVLVCGRVCVCVQVATRIVKPEIILWRPASGPHRGNGFKKHTKLCLFENVNMQKVFDR